NNVSRDAAVSANGRYVTVAYFATDLGDGDTNGMSDVFVRDTQTGTTAMVSSAGVPADGSSGLSGLSGAREISDDGRYVAFTSFATNLTSGSNNGRQQIYVKDMTTSAVVRASVNEATGEAGDRTSQTPAISGNGQVVAFRSESTNFSPLSISGDGRWVGFQSLDDQLVVGDLNGLFDVFLYDRTTEAIKLVSLNDADEQANAASFGPSVSFDGQLVLFGSTASNLVTSPASTGNQLYVRNVVSNQAPVLPAFGGDVTLTEGQSMHLTWQFSDN